MITIQRDRNPPVEGARGKWWRWTASVKSRVGYVASCGGWTPGSKRQARAHAEAAEKRLEHVHCRHVRWTQNNGLRFVDPDVTDEFVINPHKKPSGFTRRLNRGRRGEA